jgi:hypothetical protein
MALSIKPVVAPDLLAHRMSNIAVDLTQSAHGALELLEKEHPQSPIIVWAIL